MLIEMLKVILLGIVEGILKSKDLVLTPVHSVRRSLQKKRERLLISGER